MNPDLGLSHHEAIAPWLATHADAIDFLSVTTETLLAPSPDRDATLALTDHFRVALQGNYLALTGSGAFDSLRARHLASLADQCVFDWVAERLDAPAEPVVDLLDHVVERVERLQDFLGAAVLVSNGAGFLGDATSTTSLAFLSALVDRTGCGLLLDLDALCSEGRCPAERADAGDAEAATHDAAAAPDPLVAELDALDLDSIRGIAVGGLLSADAGGAPGELLGDRPAALLTRLVAACRRLRGITIGLTPARVEAIGPEGLAEGLDRMRSALPRPAGIVAFPGTATDRQGPATPRPRGYLPGHGRGAPMRLVHCAPEAETPPAAGAGDTPPTAGG